MDAPSPSSLDPQRARRSGALGLSARLLLLTILFVMVAEVLIYVPSVANFRRTWLNDRLAAAQMAALVLDAAPAEKLSDELEARLLAGVNARAVAVKSAGVRRLLAVADHVPEVVAHLRPAHRPLDRSHRQRLRDAVLARRAPGPRRRQGRRGADFVEIVLDEAPLARRHDRFLAQHPRCSRS